MVIATAKLLRRQGYYGTGLNQIVAEAEAPKGSIYFHFPGGKEQLAVEAIAASATYLDRGLLACERPTALESLDAYVIEIAGVLERTNYTDGCPIATVVLEAAVASPALGEACASAVELLLSRIAGWLERDGYSANAARERAELVYAAIEGTLMFAKVRQSTEPLMTLRGQLPQLLDRGWGQGATSASGTSVSASRPGSTGRRDRTRS
jgi:TetR/AcrR family transcriptional repressor of lmrAB and yxaGH operons